MFITLVKWSRVHLKKIKQFNYPKKLLYAACEPVYKKEINPSSDHCSYLKKNKKLKIHPYTQLLAEEYRNYLKTSPFIVFFHLNSLSRHQYRQSRNAFIKSGFMLERYDYEVAQVALTHTKFEILNFFYQTDAFNAVAFGQEINVAEILKLEKKLSTFFTLMFAIFENRIISKAQLLEYSRLPSIEVLRQQLVHTLSLPSSYICSDLSHHSQHLRDNLEIYIKS